MTRLKSAVGLAVLMMVACETKYGDVMATKVAAALGSDFKDYQPFSYPTNNFGLATAYTPPPGRETPGDADFLCDMWNCIGVKDDDIPADPVKLRDMNGFAAVGTGGALTLTEKEQRELALNVALPQIYSVVNVSGGFQKNSVTQTTMAIGQAHARKLRRKEMTDYLGTLATTHPLKQAFTTGNLVLVVADVVVDSLTVDIKVTDSSKPSLEAAIGPEVPGSAGKVFKSSKFSVKASRSVDGRYTFTIDRPVIVRRLVKRQSAAGVLGSEKDDDWKDWAPLVVPTVP